MCNFHHGTTLVSSNSNGHSRHGLHWPNITDDAPSSYDSKRRPNDCSYTFLQELDSTWILILEVMGEILKFREAYWVIKGQNWEMIPICKGHLPFWRSYSANSVPIMPLPCGITYLRLPVMENYWAGKSITGRLPEEKLHEVFWKKLPEDGGTFFTTEQTAVLEPFGITRDGLEQSFRKANRNCKLSLILSWMRILKKKH